MWNQRLVIVTPIVVGLCLVEIWHNVDEVAARKVPARQMPQVKLDALDKNICGKRLLQPLTRGSHFEMEDPDDKEEADEEFADYQDHSIDAVGREGPANRMSGGRHTFQGEHPWYVQVINYGRNVNSSCGGALIHKNLVLTAAHCVISQYGQLPLNITLSTGMTKIEAPNQTLAAQDFRFPPGFNYMYMLTQNIASQDWAVIKTHGEFRYDQLTQPICLSGFNTDMRYSGVCHAVGSGIIHDQPKTNADALFTMPMRVCPQGTLVARYDEICFTTADATNYPGRPCSGDSGSPMVCADRPDRGHAAQFYTIGLATNAPTTGCIRGNTTGFINYLDIVEHFPSILEMSKILLDGLN